MKKIEWVLRKGSMLTDANRIYAECSVNGDYFATIVQDATAIPLKYVLHFWGLVAEEKNIPVASLRVGMDMVEARIGE